MPGWSIDKRTAEWPFGLVGFLCPTGRLVSLARSLARTTSLLLGRPLPLSLHLCLANSLIDVLCLSTVNDASIICPLSHLILSSFRYIISRSFFRSPKSALNSFLPISWIALLCSGTTLHHVAFQMDPVSLEDTALGGPSRTHVAHFPYLRPIHRKR